MRRATIRTAFDDAGTATRIERAIAPDNTDEIQTRADGDAVVARVERETTGGLRSTVDDYVVNLQVADETTRRTNRHANEPTADETHDTDTP